MLKRILIPLDELHYSRTAIEYGTLLTENGDCCFDGLFIIDVPSIEKSIGPIPAGGTYYAEKEQKMRIKKEKKIAEKTINEFSELCASKNLHYQTNVLEGDPKDIIVEESRYYDLVIVACKTSFRYGAKFDKGIQHELMSHDVRPVLIFHEEFRKIKKIVMCFDGRIQSIKAIQQFVKMDIWRDRQNYLLHINNNNEEGEKLLKKMSAYLDAWNVPFEKILLPGKPEEKILEFITSNDIDMAVMGAHGKKNLMRFIVGSTTDHFLKKAKIPLFVFH